MGGWRGRTPRISVDVRLDVVVVGHLFIIIILILDVVSAAVKATRDVPLFWDGATPLASGRLTRMMKCAFPYSATCRRPIKGAAERPATSSPLWNESLLFSPLVTQTASVVENRITNRHFQAGVPRSGGLTSSPPRPVFAPPSAGQSKALSRGTFPWVKLLLLAVLAALFFFIYQTMEPNSISPFNVAEVGGARNENP